MNRISTTALLATLTFAVTLLPAHAEGPAPQCYAQRADFLIGKRLTREVREQARVAARANTVTVNSLSQDFDPDRLRIITDFDEVITRMYCG
ncbi:peptidase inhibitor [Pseudomonas sp. PB120]|uniref:peptidase inhibitor n=1 Tax=Pseudomonas sp. PB120 TaxID=2494700 RepID=UPI0012FE79FB|nr:peptidase inhibitor [Pseudomonas sp. PB120]MVV47903.1 peptidase inhibitor [Pseudomonas sp. PB120]